MKFPRLRTILLTPFALFALVYIAAAVTQFYQQPDAGEKYLVISTLAPKLTNNVLMEYAHFINEGYSTVGGETAAGDAGNGVVSLVSM